jgi:small subunit ribosomal protein S21
MEGNVSEMYEVKIKAGESIESALRRFKKLCADDVKEIKRRRYYEKPSDVRRKRRVQASGRKT